MDVETKTTAGQVMGIIGIVLGVVSLVLAFIPCIGIMAFIPGVLALTFSIISIVQASNGYGSKGLGIGALIVSLVSIVLAAAWLIIFSGTFAFADRAIRNSERIEILGKEFGKAFEKEFDKGDVRLKIVSDSLENSLRQLENELDSLDGYIPEEKARKAGQAAARALKKSTRVVIETDSGKIQIEANNNSH